MSKNHPQVMFAFFWKSVSQDICVCLAYGSVNSTFTFTVTNVLFSVFLFGLMQTKKFKSPPLGKIHEIFMYLDIDF